MEATRLQDCALLAKAFQKKMMSAASEPDLIGSLLPSVSMMQVNATSAAGNLLNSITPPLPDALVDTLISAAAEGPKVELPENDATRAAAKLTSLGLEWLEKCIPCNLRLKFRADLIITLDDTLLDSLAFLLDNYLKELNFILGLLNSGAVYQDACLLLKVLDDICVPDIQRIISLFAALLYRQNTKEIMNQTDIMKLLILPIFQPMFANITQVFGQYKFLVTDPLNCVVANLSAQLEKLKTGGFIQDTHIRDIEDKTNLLMSLAGIGPQTSLGIDYSSEDIKSALQTAQTVGFTMDEGISAVQNSLGSSIFELKRMIAVGIVEVETVLGDLQRELTKFIGGSQLESNTFLLKQFDKLMIIRMISFLISVVKAIGTGFSCNIPDGEVGNSVLNKFFQDFLGPSSQVVISVDPVTNETVLLLDSRAREPIASSVKETKGENAKPPAIIDPTGNNNVDQALSDIINKAITPVTIRPKCFFQTQTPDDQLLAQFLAQLDATEV